MRLAEPLWLLGLLLIPLPWLRAKGRQRLAWPTLSGFQSAPWGMAGWPRQVLLVLQASAIACLSVALARPQSVAGQVRVTSQGVVIVVAFDRSTSMQTQDFPSTEGATSRLESARKTFARFVRGRPDDLIGLVTFAMFPETACPPTLDHAFLIAAAGAIEPAGPLENGTNLGDAVAWSIQELQEAPASQKVLVLLTDGRQEIAPGALVREPLDPEQAARLAGELGLTLHTIAIGRPPSLIESEPSGVPAADDGPDFALLQRMADLGHGRAFTAADLGELEAVFHEIDQLEKAPLVGLVRTRYHEWYAHWALAAVVALALSLFVSSGRLREIP